MIEDIFYYEENEGGLKMPYMIPNIRDTGRE